jgi:protein phosphatase
MAKLPSFEFAALTDTGRVREHNEDAVACSDEYGYAILADGMGGYNAGEIASEMAIAVAGKYLSEKMAAGNAGRCDSLLCHAILQANEAIYEAAANPAYRGMGTTIVAAALGNATITIAHVGDSRAYRFREGRLEQITRDHSVLQVQLDAGLITPEAARSSPIRNLVTRAVGNEVPLEVEVHEHATKPGDLYLLCSDGLTDMLEDAEIQALLLRTHTDLDAACKVLVDEANARGGNDNISIILCRVLPGTTEKGLLNKILRWVH